MKRKYGITEGLEHVQDIKLWYVTILTQCVFNQVLNCAILKASIKNTADQNDASKDFMLVQNGIVNQTQKTK